MHQQVYHSRDIQAWEQRWFAAQNSSLGLMQQAAWSVTQQLQLEFELIDKKIQKIAVWCGKGNNAGDGYFIASYLNQLGYDVDIFATELGHSADLHSAREYAHKNNLSINQHFNVENIYDCHLDALIGIGLKRNLDENFQNIIHLFNQHSGFKVSIDVPSGLNANTGEVLTCAIKADLTFTILGLKTGLFTGQGKEYAGKIRLISILPADAELKEFARLSPIQINFPQRQAFGHKGSYGHVLIVGGHPDMGGAVMMAAESAFSAGAGKVTVVCHPRHHVAILARAPNIMVRDINVLTSEDIQSLIDQVDAVSFGMGLGRDDWAEHHYLIWFPLLQRANLTLVLDADALWFLALNPKILNTQTYLTPHPGEAAKLLNCSVNEIESDRIQAIHHLREKFSGQWVLKGSGSLILEHKLWICTEGNAGMATGGMGDVLAGMISSLKAQFQNRIQLHQIVTLHALAGDFLAKKGMRGLQAHHMQEAIYHVVNSKNKESQLNG